MSRVFNAVTGPSGAGKSAFSKQQLDWEHHLYNLDDWARRLGGVDDPVVRESAWKALVERLADDMYKGRSPVTLDHVFDSRTINELLAPAKALEYWICLWVVCPDDPQICVERVKKRKGEGGHGRSARTIFELYESALNVASEISIESHETMLIDSSGDGFKLVGYIRDFRSNIMVRPAPVWISKHFSSSFI